VKDKLKIAFSTYINKTIAVIGGKKALIKKGKTEDNFNPNHWLIDKIEELEKSTEFKEFVSRINQILGSRISDFAISQVTSMLINFLRRSECYLKIWEGTSLDIDDYLEKLWDAYNEKVVTTTIISFIDIRFPENFIDFGSFKIQRLTKEKLDSLCQNQINHLFYPWAEWDTENLSHYWFIIQTKEPKKTDKIKPNVIKISEEIINEIKNMYHVKNDFPDEIIRQLVLFDCNASENIGNKDNRMWMGFSILRTIAINDDLLESPSLAPKRIPFMPDFYVNSYIETEKPFYAIDLKEIDLKKLKKLVKITQDFNKIAKNCNWEFLNNAMKYLAKAFFSNGLEQLLWHMTTLEALFCLKDEGYIQEKVARRLSSALEEDETKIQEQIKNLYTKRSEMVHGEPKPKQVYYEDLYQARDLARRSVVWFLEYLLEVHEELASRCVKAKRYPQRKAILNSLGHVKEWKKPLDILLENWQKQQQNR
jgi:hypothetical protein